jgi:hypothetical protein
MDLFHGGVSLTGIDNDIRGALRSEIDTRVERAA